MESSAPNSSEKTEVLHFVFNPGDIQSNVLVPSQACISTAEISPINLKTMKSEEVSLHSSSGVDFEISEVIGDKSKSTCLSAVKQEMNLHDDSTQGEMTNMTKSQINTDGAINLKQSESEVLFLEPTAARRIKIEEEEYHHCTLRDNDEDLKPTNDSSDYGITGTTAERCLHIAELTCLPDIDARDDGDEEMKPTVIDVTADVLVKGSEEVDYVMDIKRSSDEEVKSTSHYSCNGILQQNSRSSEVDEIFRSGLLLQSTEDSESMRSFNEQTKLFKLSEQNRMSLVSQNSRLRKNSSVSEVYGLSAPHRNAVGDVDRTRSSGVLETTDSLMHPVVRLIKDYCSTCESLFRSNDSVIHLVKLVHVCKTTAGHRNKVKDLDSRSSTVLDTNSSLMCPVIHLIKDYCIICKSIFTSNVSLMRSSVRPVHVCKRLFPSNDSSAHLVRNASVTPPPDAHIVKNDQATASPEKTAKIISPGLDWSNRRDNYFICPSSSAELGETCKEKPFACSLCPFRSKRKYGLTSHMRIHTGEKPFACTLCSYKCADKGCLSKHVRNHTGEKNFACAMCPYRCYGKYRLSKHMRRHTGEKPFTCSLCSYKCNEKQSLKEHMRRHAGENPFACKICSYRCKTRRYLRTHMHIHTCVERSDGYNNKSSLLEHTSCHAWEKEFACAICPYRCKEKSSLDSHTRRHTGEKPFACTVCSFRCSEKSVYEYHMLGHTGEKPYACEYCAYRCKAKVMLLEHVRRHTGDTRFACTICSYRCYSSSELTVHMRKHTGEKKYACATCSRMFSSSNNLSKHARIHTGEKPLACSMCSYRCRGKSVLREHVRVHTGEKPFACSQCSYKCVSKGALSGHKRSHHCVGK